jgi:hypothetical protein
MTLGTAIRYLKQGNWQRAHEIVQADESALGCWAHGIVHMMEGDQPNARYWYRRAHRSFPGEGRVADELVALARAWKDDRESTGGEP